MKKIFSISLAIVVLALGLTGCKSGQEAIEVGNPPTSESTMPEIAHLRGITFSTPAEHTIEYQDDESLIISGPELLLTADAFELGEEIADFFNEVSDDARNTTFELDDTISCNQADDGHLVLGECVGKGFVVQYRIEYDESLNQDELPDVSFGIITEYDENKDKRDSLGNDFRDSDNLTKSSTKPDTPVEMMQNSPDTPFSISSEE